ncbi:MAG: hypothetical protein NZ108_02835, partial [Bacteroidia bacterium]|nr:hypothetical protein [Bacteroidia bacterium]
INGKPINTIILDDFFRQLKPNSTFSIKVLSEGKEKTIEIRYTGKSHPKSLTLNINSNLTTTQKQNLDVWLSSRVK